MLTPEERRGAWLVLALVAIGAGWDATAIWRRPAPRATAEAARAAQGWRPDSPAAVPSPPDSERSEASGPPARELARVISLNRASAAELDELPGIGPVLARRIVEHRDRHGPFRSPEELRAVRGVGPALLARLRGRVVAGP